MAYSKFLRIGLTSLSGQSQSVLIGPEEPQGLRFFHKLKAALVAHGDGTAKQHGQYVFHERVKTRRGRAKRSSSILARAQCHLDCAAERVPSHTHAAHYVKAAARAPAGYWRWGT